MKRGIIILALILPFSIEGLISLTSAPSGTTIVTDNTDALDYYCYGTPPTGEIKVTFYGSRYSDGQYVWDPDSPFIGAGIDFENPFYCLCENFYYRNGYVNVYTRPNSSSSWEYQGYMYMSSSNCTMDGSKVTVFTVNCQYLIGED
jgi:hypothetical protein